MQPACTPGLLLGKILLPTLFVYASNEDFGAHERYDYYFVLYSRLQNLRKTSLSSSKVYGVCISQRHTHFEAAHVI